MQLEQVFQNICGVDCCTIELCTKSNKMSVWPQYMQQIKYAHRKATNNYNLLIITILKHMWLGIMSLSSSSSCNFCYNVNPLFILCIWLEYNLLRATHKLLEHFFSVLIKYLWQSDLASYGLKLIMFICVCYVFSYIHTITSIILKVQLLFVYTLYIVTYYYTCYYYYILSSLKMFYIHLHNILMITYYVVCQCWHI